MTGSNDINWWCAMDLPTEFVTAPREFTGLPFWFWNDDLDADELRRQIADFDAHGVHGFIIHPRVGLPESLGWMSNALLDFYEVALKVAAERDMLVILYDEGMYPSGSSAGQVVERDASFATRCVHHIELDGDQAPGLPADQNLIAVVRRVNGQHVAVVDRPSGSHIRGLHYLDEHGAEFQPPSGDLLNPDAVATFIELVYDRFAERFGEYFGNTVMGIFTDEPSMLGRDPFDASVLPGTTGILEHVNAALGYDFTPHLPALWYDDEPNAARHRHDYKFGIQRRLEQTFFSQIRDWCAGHGVPVIGHPQQADDIAAQRFFDIPGQDIVWRWVALGPTATEGQESTQGKCSSSAMIHYGRRRNSNECCGAFGHEMTFDEMKWVADWCFVRGVNLLYPHAFYYSARGLRRDERPPAVGPNSPWWDRYKPFADYCRRICWLNTDATHACRIAILGDPDHLSWGAAKVLFEHQRDFNYVDVQHLGSEGHVDSTGVGLADMHYDVLIIDDLERPTPAVEKLLQPLAGTGRVIAWQESPQLAIAGMITAGTEAELVAAIDAHVEADLICTPRHPEVRYRHIIKDGAHYFLITNEGFDPVETTIETNVAGRRCWIDPYGTEVSEMSDDEVGVLPPYHLRLLQITG